MSDPHLACYQTESRLRDKIDHLLDEIDHLKDHNKKLENALENVHYELEEAQDQIAHSRLDEETEIEADYRKAREKLDDEIVAAERGAITAKVFNKTAEHAEEWHTAYITGLRRAAQLIAP